MQIEPPKIEEPVSVIRVEPVWVFQLGRRDSLLVLKALGGRIDIEDPEEVMAARELGDRLTRLRAAAGRDLMHHLESAASAANGERRVTTKGKKAS